MKDDLFLDPARVASVFIKAYDETEEVKTDAGRHAFVARMLGYVMDEAMRSVEKDPFRTLLNHDLTDHVLCLLSAALLGGNKCDAAELIALAKGRLEDPAWRWQA